jgi:hypothetical protein
VVFSFGLQNVNAIICTDILSAEIQQIEEFFSRLLEIVKSETQLLEHTVESVFQDSNTSSSRPRNFPIYPCRHI